MKKILNYVVGFSLFVFLFVSCKKEENKVTYDGGTNPVLSSTAPTSTLTLAKANESNTWNIFSWTNPAYKFNTGSSSQDVTYTLQIDSVGSNFTNPNIQEVSISKDLSNTITVKQINTVLAKLQLKEDQPHNIEVRVKSSLANNSAILYSNALKFILVPYLDVVVTLPENLPTAGSNNGDLFLVGDASPGGWNNPVPVPTQKFTRTSSTTYELTIALVGGKEYLMLPKNGDWGNKYAVTDKNLQGLSSGGDFGANKNDNFPGPSASGNYKIVVDFKTGKFSVTHL